MSNSKLSAQKEFFRAEYREIEDQDREKAVLPTVWIGSQGFDLTPRYADDNQTAKENAEWFVSMFKRAIDNYHLHQLESISEEERNNAVVGLEIFEMENRTSNAVKGFYSGFDKAIELLKSKQ